MAARKATSYIGPVFAEFPDVAGGDTVTIPGTLGFNTTGMTWAVQVRLVDDTSAAPLATITTATSAAVGTLVIGTPGATTAFTITLPGTYASAAYSAAVYLSIILTTTASGAVRTWAASKVGYSWRASR
jgi:hypothetical protein